MGKEDIKLIDNNTKKEKSKNKKQLLSLPESSLNLTVDNQTDILSLNIGFRNLDSERVEQIDKFEK